MITTKNRVNPISAAVIPHVALRSGQRTCRSSYHAPLKYVTVAVNGVATAFSERRFDVTIGAAEVLIDLGDFFVLTSS